ncbi:DUF5011 domain-containing protein [Faecalitalea cylindroides]|uniref:immunoglobulin-like domain-containing protein n=1 Tax=Faecalitalea cylindroides TaxID=39483 RepID=UPI00195B7835|nr:immunoglobulin-like domain-containing protein [Faecalitalea cylindroides]MBM6810953.1 DUF5011 domain-containing protein [Faecalitalea cylindroides]
MKKRQKSIIAIALTTMMTMNQFAIPMFAQKSDVENSVDTTTETNEMDTGTDSSQEDVQIQEETNQILEEEKNTDNKVYVYYNTENEKLTSESLIIASNQTTLKTSSSEETENSVAEVTMNGTIAYYDTLNEAFDTVSDVGGTATITLLKDAQLNGSAVAGKSINGNITFIGGDYTISGNKFGINIGGNLTIESGNFTSNIPLVIFGTLNINGGTFNNALISQTGGNINVYNGNITNRLQMRGGIANIYGGDLYYIVNSNQSGTINVHGGTIHNVAGKVNYHINNITLDKDSVSLAPNTTVTLKATIYPVISAPYPILWESSKLEVATVKNGTVTAVAPGEAMITVSVEGKEATCKVTVTKGTQISPDTSKLVEKYRDNDSLALKYEASDDENINNLQFAYTEGENASLPSNNEWKNVTSEGMISIGNLDGATPYTIFLRFAETEYYSASDVVSKVFYTKYSGVNAQINYWDEKLTGLLSNKEYYINLTGTAIETITSDDKGSIVINENWMGKTIYISLKSKPGSQYTEVSIPSRPDKPTTLKGEITGKNDCKITGLEDNIFYEISSNNGQTWNDVNVENGEITGLSLGTYQVRVKASDKSFASLPATVTIEKSDSSIAFKEDFNLKKTYDEKQVTIDVNEDVVTTGSTGNISFVYEENVNGTWQKLSSAPTSAGTYRVTANLDGDTNFNSASSQPLEFTISKADSSVGFTTDSLDKTYDGNSIFVGTKQSGSSNVATKTWYELDKDGTWRELEEAPTNAGSYKVVATVKGNDNYNGAEAEMTFVIRKAKPSYTLPTDLVIKQGDALSTVSLPKGFTWIDDTQTANVLGTHAFKTVFTPADTTNYETVEVEIRVEVVSAISQVDKAPVIHVEDKTLTVGDTFDAMKGVTATDAEDGDLTDKIVITKNTVDTSKAGKYTVVYEVTDSHGTRVVRTIYVTVQQKTANTNKKDSKKDTAQTSTQTNVMAWTILGIVSLGALLVALFKRKHQ